MLYFLSYTFLLCAIKDDHITGELHLETTFRTWLCGTVTTKGCQAVRVPLSYTCTMATKASIAYTYLLQHNLIQSLTKQLIKKRTFSSVCSQGTVDDSFVGLRKTASFDHFILILN